MLKIRRSRDRLIFNMGIPIRGKDGLYIEFGPRKRLINEVGDCCITSSKSDQVHRGSFREVIGSFDPCRAGYNLRKKKKKKIYVFNHFKTMTWHRLLKFSIMGDNGPFIEYTVKPLMGHSTLLGATFCVCQTRLSNMSVQCHIHNFISFIPNKTICWIGSISIWQKRCWFKFLDLNIACIQYDYYQNPKQKTVNVTVVNVTWTNIGQTHVTFTKFQYKYSHFVSRQIALGK